MKMTVIILIVISVALMLYVTEQEKPEFIATASIDGLGFYRLTNYEIDTNGCLNFYDLKQNYVHFCGGYELTPIEEHHIENVEIIKNFTRKGLW